MKDKIVDLVSRNIRLLKNFSYLSVIQLINILIPLIIYPYLIKVLGEDTYGNVIYAQTIIGYIVIIINFGFNITATKEVSVNRDNAENLSEIISAVYAIKSFLTLLSFGILLIYMSLSFEGSQNQLLLLFTFSLCLNELLFPVWYFQGIEEMKFITIITLVGRIIFFVAIFLFVKEKSHYLRIPLINGFCALVTALISLYIIFVKNGLTLILPKFSRVFKFFKDAIPIFVSEFSVKTYLGTNKLILGQLSGMRYVAYYDLAEKIITAIKVPIKIAGQVILPKISLDKDINFIHKFFKYSFFFNVTSMLLVLFFGKYFILFLGGEGMLPSLDVLKILALTIPIVAMSSIFGLQLLIPIGYINYFSKSVILSAILYIILVFGLYIFNEINLMSLSFVNVLVELFGCLILYFGCRKYRLI
ncbi:polysaccharide transporter, PST family [Pustulibacterium marinum]|uniref:Polysaccharide transporter, PST family n=1 Tax=Pustulibacterium marinum TaxID=1224947 RepID=A0A1I7ETM6_9FLAO|nr:oligosaccharide flippase family protein [Pustulibacterium marinum]SFU27285.1 polysaccharide transporter, PST family [Pustulibacterium marinum]